MILFLFGMAARAADLLVIDHSAAGDEPAPSVGLPANRLVTVEFTDAGGAPWPVADILFPEAGGLAVRRGAGHPNVLILQALRRGEPGNLVALLEGLPRPVHLNLGREADAATRVLLRLADEREAAGVPAVSGTPSPAPAEAADLDAAIRDYLLSNPDVLREALDPSRQLAARVASRREELLDAPDAPVLGDAAGGVTVVEFFDYRCGFCRRSMDAVRMALERAGVRLQMREYPILGEDSERAARLALAAARQGAYRPAHFLLMEREAPYDDAAVAELAAALNLDAARLREDMQSAEIGAAIEANRALARQLGVTGTPAFLVIGPSGVKVSPGALDPERLAAMIDDAS